MHATTAPNASFPRISSASPEVPDDHAQTPPKLNGPHEEEQIEESFSNFVQPQDVNVKDPILQKTAGGFGEAVLKAPPPVPISSDGLSKSAALKIDILMQGSSSLDLTGRTVKNFSPNVMAEIALVEVPQTNPNGDLNLEIAKKRPLDVKGRVSGAMLPLPEEQMLDAQVMPAERVILAKPLMDQAASPKERVHILSTFEAAVKENAPPAAPIVEVPDLLPLIEDGQDVFGEKTHVDMVRNGGPLRASEMMRPEMARNVAQQLAEFGKVDFGRPLEIALSPEELGRVRMTLHAQDTSLLVSIEAERFETAELMRRHMEELEQEFKELGYGDVSFDFGQSRGEDNAPRQENSTGRLEPMADDEILDVRGAEVMTGDRIDIRL